MKRELMLLPRHTRGRKQADATALPKSVHRKSSTWCWPRRRPRRSRDATREKQ